MNITIVGTVKINRMRNVSLRTTVRRFTAYNGEVLARAMPRSSRETNDDSSSATISEGSQDSDNEHPPQVPPRDYPRTSEREEHIYDEPTAPVHHIHRPPRHDHSASNYGSRQQTDANESLPRSYGNIAVVRPNVDWNSLQRDAGEAKTIITRVVLMSVATLFALLLLSESFRCM